MKPTRRDAPSKVVTLAHRRAQKVHRVGSPPGGLRHALDVWEAHGYAQRYRPRTLRGYRLAMTRAIADLPEAPTCGDFEGWMHSLLADGHSPHTANWYLRCVRAVLESAARVTHNHAVADAAGSARGLLASERLPRCPSRDALVRVVECRALRHNAERAFVWVIGTTGLRLGEMLGLQPGDFDPYTGRLICIRQRGGRGRKNHKAHIVVLDPRGRKLLTWTIANRRSVTPRQHGAGSDGYIFPWGERYCTGMMTRIRRELSSDVDEYFPRGTAWHAFRHLVGTETARLTGRHVDVQRVLGDASPYMATTYMATVRGTTSVEISALAKSLAAAGDPKNEGKPMGTGNFVATPLDSSLSGYGPDSKGDK